MKTSPILCAAALLGGVLATTNAFAADAVVDGPALYKENCAKCHGDTGKADSWRGYLVFAQDFSKASFQKGRSDDDILNKINRGPRIMPAYEKTLTLAERQALVQVIRDFAERR